MRCGGFVVLACHQNPADWSSRRQDQPGEAGVVNHGTHRTHGRGYAVEAAEVVVAVRRTCRRHVEARRTAEAVVRPRDCHAVLNLTGKVKPGVLKEMRRHRRDSETTRPRRS
jgi:hypothetical protein